jgi:predicted nucleic acid-binding protein
MARYSLDSNVVTAILKKHVAVLATLKARLKASHEIIVCPFVYYEVQRGLLDLGAQVQLKALASFVSPLRWLEFNREIWNAAAEGWVKAKKAGSTHLDPDLLIAYHAQHFEAVVVTRNMRDFQAYEVQVENWHGE